MGEIDLVTGTLGKALGGAMGGYTTGRRALIELLRQRSRPYLFSNSLAPAIVGASLEVFRMLDETTELRDRLEANVRLFKSEMIRAGFDIRDGASAIVPILLYDAALSQRFADAMLEEGVYVVGFFYPVVPQGQARIRVQLSAAHSPEQLNEAVEAFVRVKNRLM
jgi:glycine C-acetyltransferase